MMNERKMVAYGLLAFLVLSIVMNAGLGELRLRTIPSPWQRERDHVLEMLRHLEEERSWNVEREAVMERLERIERKIDSESLSRRQRESVLPVEEVARYENQQVASTVARRGERSRTETATLRTGVGESKSISKRDPKSVLP